MIGIDVVDVARLAAALERMPSLEARLFTEAERAYCNGKTDPVTRFAGTMAAKEAVIKASATRPPQRVGEAHRDHTGAWWRTVRARRGTQRLTPGFHQPRWGSGGRLCASAPSAGRRALRTRV